MARKYYSEEVKAEAVALFLEGQTSTRIAKKLKVHSSDLVRKWVQAYRELHNIPAQGYRNIATRTVATENQRLLQDLAKISKERDAALMALKLCVTKEIEGWEEALNLLKEVGRSD